jgi:hypothetical protein
MYADGDRAERQDTPDISADFRDAAAQKEPAYTQSHSALRIVSFVPVQRGGLGADGSPRGPVPCPKRGLLALHSATSCGLTCGKG